MRVLLIDDNRLMLEGLQNLLEAHGIQVSGLASDGRLGIELTRAQKPDVILMDISMPGLDGLATTRLIKAEWPEARIVILTTSADDQNLFEAVKSGASGYLLKSIDADTLIESLQQVQEGIPPFSPGLAAKLLEEFRHMGEVARANAAPKAAGTMAGAAAGSGSGAAAGSAKQAAGPVAMGLNSRQVEVLKLVAQGLSYKEAGARLHISPHTVRYHMAEIMAQLHIENRAQVLALAGQLGLGR